MKTDLFCEGQAQYFGLMLLVVCEHPEFSLLRGSGRVSQRLDQQLQQMMSVFWQAGSVTEKGTARTPLCPGLRLPLTNVVLKAPGHLASLAQDFIAILGSLLAYCYFSSVRENGDVPVGCLGL